MKLRGLKQKDADRMLEWMRDSYVVEKLQTDFIHKTIEDCYSFIESSQSETDIHLAIVDDSDQYMGTVSLKHITKDAAEFAIVICKDAMGKGYSIWAMREIIKIGFEKYGVEDIYWCVAADNLRALSFYDKNHFQRVDNYRIKIAGGYTKKQIDSYIWYQVSKKEDKEGLMSNCTLRTEG